MAKVLSEAELLSLVDALADGDWHSGETLAEAAGITRAALAKRIARLGDWGLGAQSQVGRGYRLPQALERLVPERIAAALPPQAPMPQVQAIVDSTNTRLLEAGSGADPQALFAEFQTAGRGRRGRSWLSPFGSNLYLSVSWSFPAWPERLTALPLAIGAGVADWLHGLGVADVAVKWPNDLWIARRKLGGILIETRGEGGGACRVVVGIGLNLAMHGEQAAAIDQPWIALREALPGMPSRNALAAGLLGSIAGTLQRFSQEGFEPFRPLFERYDATRDLPVRIAADTPLNGIARGIDAAGALLIETGTGTERVLAGDVSLRLS